MIRVCVAGITGWMGRAVAAAIARADDLELTGGVARTAAGEPLASVVDGTAGSVSPSVADALDGDRPDVLVDYTDAAAVRPNVLASVERGVAVVIGASGLTADDYAEIDRRAREAGVGVIAAGNFSVLAALLLRFAGEAAQHVSAWEVVDYGSAGKRDVPSGTARELAERLGGIRRPDAPAPPESGPVEARGAAIAGTRVHSLRLPGFVVSTEIVFAAPGERLTLRHDPGESPDPYVAGTLLAVRAVGGRVGLTRGLDSLL
jgi:4-hydroxy-tetrahydrodipicolinate reductase